MKTYVNLFFCPMNKKMFSPNIEWYIGKSPGMCTLFFKTRTWYLKFILHHAVIKFFSNIVLFMSNVCSVGFKLHRRVRVSI